MISNVFRKVARPERSEHLRSGGRLGESASVDRIEIGHLYAEAIAKIGRESGEVRLPEELHQGLAGICGPIFPM